MKKRTIHRYLRFQNLFNLIVDIFLLILIYILVKQFNVDNTLIPTQISSVQNIDSKMIKTSAIITIAPDNLHYTGYEVHNGRKTGYYHYIIDGDCCFFVILKDINNTPRTITGKLAAVSGANMVLLDGLSKDLNWNEEELSRITSRYVLDEYAFNKPLSKIIYYMLILFVAIVFGHILILLVGLLWPPIALYTMHNNCYFLMPKRLLDAEDELVEKLIYSRGNMRLTKNYLIGLHYKSVCIIPLDNIVWAYYHSVLKRHLIFKHDISYSLRIVTDSRKVYNINNQKKSDCLELLDILSNMYPEIMIGYNDNEQETFLGTVKNMITKKSEEDT